MQVIDLRFLGRDDTVAAFLIETPEGLVLIESGPYSTFGSLEAALRALGHSVSDVRHVLLTHIHFDHAGAAWALAEAGATVHVHPFGAPHLAAPEKLYRSAKRIYGDEMETLWGEMRPIAPERLRAVGHGESLSFGGHIFTALHTPGHAVHHIAWQWGDEVFCGDVAGVRIGSGPVTPPCPPPDIHLPDWKRSLSTIRGLRPKALWLTHFGRVEDVEDHLDRLENALDDWAEWIRPHWAAGEEQSEVVPRFAERVHDGLRRAGLTPRDIARYEGANPAFMSVAGLYRYWQQTKEL
jgi:glyoxylase-like metal-dependent hydrolase (beta-lactamase superfamily II)